MLDPLQLARIVSTTFGSGDEFLLDFFRQLGLSLIHILLGDELYGKKADRLYLHAEYIEFRHPIYGDILCIQKEADFHKKI